MAGHDRGVRGLQRDAEVRRFDHAAGGRPRRQLGREALADACLVDRYHLLLFPVLLGAGKKLFSDTDKDKQSLMLVESEAYGNGVQKLVYDIIR